MQPRLSLLEFAFLARHEKPLASSLACFLIAESQVKGWPVPTELDTVNGWEQRLKSAFDSAAEGDTDWGELQSVVIRLATVSKEQAQKLMS